MVRARSLDDDDLRAARKTEARLRLAYRTHLAWLEGYPLAPTDEGLRWQTIPRRGLPSVELVDAERVHLAHWALHEIERETRGCRLELSPTDLTPAWPRLAAALSAVDAARRAGSLPDPWPLLPVRARELGGRPGTARDLEVDAPGGAAWAVAWCSVVAGGELLALRFVDRHRARWAPASPVLLPTIGPRLRPDGLRAIGPRLRPDGLRAIGPRLRPDGLRAIGPRLRPDGLRAIGPRLRPDGLPAIELCLSG